MNKLLKVNFSLMKYRFDVKCCMVMGVVLGIIYPVLGKLNDNLTWFDMFEMGIMMIMLLSAVGGLFISRDYTNNTIRNKLTVGHKRNDIYLANQITDIFIFCLPVIIYIITSVICNLCFIGTKTLDISAFTKNVTVFLFAHIATSAITTFVAMAVKSNAGGVLTLILMYPTMIFSVVSQEFGEAKWLEIVNDIIPLSQLAVLMMPDEEPAVHIFYSVLITIAFILGGMAIFRRADLK